MIQQNNNNEEILPVLSIEYYFFKDRFHIQAYSHHGLLTAEDLNIIFPKQIQNKIIDKMRDRFIERIKNALKAGD